MLTDSRQEISKINLFKVVNQVEIFSVQVDKIRLDLKSRQFSIKKQKQHPPTTTKKQHPAVTNEKKYKDFL